MDHKLCELAMDEKDIDDTMDPEIIKNNAQDLERELNWISEVIDTRFKIYFGKDAKVNDIIQIDPPQLEAEHSVFANFIAHYEFGFIERLALGLSMIPHIKPQLLDVFFTRNADFDRRFTEFGGMIGDTHGGFIPTGETLMFVLTGSELKARFLMLELFERDHVFSRHQILKLAPVRSNEPMLSGVITLSSEILDYITTGNIRKPDFSINFPAQYINTEQKWEDLILNDYTLEQIHEIKTWIAHEYQLKNDWGLGKKIRPGYRSLFYGPPGTGKTMTACLLGKETARDVYRIDLSTVISKYIGETEKNLSKVFDQAESKHWILFFDEADALFGKRTKIDDAHDKYANQEVSYLLQRLEMFDGIVILASNMKSNLDAAFVRRFESIIHFPMPQSNERLMLWKNGFSPKSGLDKNVDLDAIARKYELSGGSTMNVIRYCSMKALERSSNVIQLKDLEEGIRKELQKEGKTA